MHKGRSKVVRPWAKHVPPVPATPELNLPPLVGLLADPPGTGRSAAGSAHRLPPRQPLREDPQQQAEPDVPLGDLKPLNTQAQALVMSVVDERTLGPVTRSRLTLRIQPTDGEPFEVTTRVAFPTPEERARIKVGKTIGVRYDSEDHRRVVVDPEQDAGN